MRAISQGCDLTSASTQAGFASTSEAVVTAVVDGELPRIRSTSWYRSANPRVAPARPRRCDWRGTLVTAVSSPAEPGLIDAVGADAVVGVGAGAGVCFGRAW